MCGIAGFAGQFSSDLLTAMGEVIAHRGPDGRGEVLLDLGLQPVGLAHRRLAIIDLSPAARQPMTTSCPLCGPADAGTVPDRGLWLTYNGEIYNYLDLRADLEAQGHVFHSRSDTEVLLHLYGRDGLAMLERLNGIFAFALYDGRARGQSDGIQPGDLLLARDGFGVKPLYYAETSGGLLFASELKALLQYPDLSRDLDPVALHSYLAYLWAPAPLTPLKAVRKLPPGQALIVRNGKIGRQWTFYDLPYGYPVMDGTEDEIANELRVLLETAVKRQMVADVPVGAFLSGGLDSSSVVAMMRRVEPSRRIPCYSIGFVDGSDLEGSPADLPYARRVASHLGLELRPIEVKPDIIQHLDRMLYHLDEPQADPAPINALLIADQARRDGIPVLLSGAGGDDLFSGYRRHWALRLERLWGWLPHGIRSAMARWATDDLNRSAAAASHEPSPFLRRVRKALAHADLSAEDRLIAYFWWGGECLRRALYSPELGKALRDVDTAAPLRESLARISHERDPLNRMLYLEAKHFLADHNLNYTDKTGMAAGVEVRVPLLDPELAEFATRIPSSLKQKGRVGKAILKKAMEPYLPRDVIYRPKTGFGAPLRRWLRHELREVVEDTLSVGALRRRGLFEPGAVRRLIEQDRSGVIDGAYTIFSLMCIELWCRIFVDGRVPASVRQTCPLTTV